MRIFGCILDETQERLLLRQGQCMTLGHFIAIGIFDCRQNTIRGIHTDVFIINCHRKNLMQNILDNR